MSIILAVVVVDTKNTQDSKYSNQLLNYSMRYFVTISRYILLTNQSVAGLIVNFFTETWSVEDITGDRPPGVQGHTLTMIDSEKYSVFGGYGRGTWHNENIFAGFGDKGIIILICTSALFM